MNMATKIFFNGQETGYVTGRVYYTKRKPMEKFGGESGSYGFSEALLDMLENNHSVMRIVIRPFKESGGIAHAGQLTDWRKSKYYQENGDDDVQRFVPISELKEIDENSETPHFVNYDDMLDFLRDMKERYGTGTIPQGTFYSEAAAQHRAWLTYAIANCLRNLRKLGYIKIGNNAEIILSGTYWEEPEQEEFATSEQPMIPLPDGQKTLV